MEYWLRGIIGQGVQRGKIMPEVSWTSDTRGGGVSGLVEPFRTTFVFEINSSGYFNSTGQIIGQTVRRGRFDVRYVRGGGVVNQWIAYQFGCIKFFDPIYRLKDIDFISLIN